MTNLDRSGTIPAPPPIPDEHDTGKVPRQTTEDVRVYLAVVQMQEQLGSIARYLEGRMDGVSVDIAQSQAFEVRTAKALSGLDEKLDRLIALNETLANGLLEASQKIIYLSEWQRKRDRACEDCPNVAVKS
jgi:hypothetical protein